MGGHRAPRHLASGTSTARHLAAGTSTWRRRARLVVLALSLVAVMLGPAAGASNHKTYTADVSPHSVSGGESLFTATLVNQSSQQQLGSANITPPPGFTLLTSPAPAVSPAGTAKVNTVDNVLELRSLSAPPGGTVTASFSAFVECESAGGSWGIRAKQANNFQGPPGNDLVLDAAGSNLAVTVTGDCAVAVRFVEARQPADAQVDTTISSAPANPSGPPIQVEVIDAAGERVLSSTAAITMAIGANPGGGDLDGTLTRNAVDGVATFDDLTINAIGEGYTLVASSAGLGEATSSSFNIYHGGDSCEENTTCEVTAEVEAVVGEVTGVMRVVISGTAGPGGGTLFVSLIDDDFSCGDPFNHAPLTVTVDFENVGPKTATMFIDSAIDKVQPNNGVAHYQVCYESDVPFRDRDGNLVNKGLLPDCAPAPQSPTPPCVKSKTKAAGGDVAITILTETQRFR